LMRARSSRGRHPGQTPSMSSQWWLSRLVQYRSRGLIAWMSLTMYESRTNLCSTVGRNQRVHHAVCLDPSTRASQSAVRPRRLRVDPLLRSFRRGSSTRASQRAVRPCHLRVDPSLRSLHRGSSTRVLFHGCRPCRLLLAPSPRTHPRWSATRVSFHGSRPCCLRVSPSRSSRCDCSALRAGRRRLADFLDNPIRATGRVACRAMKGGRRQVVPKKRAYQEKARLHRSSARRRHRLLRKIKFHQGFTSLLRFCSNVKHSL
jgi:hypothetical protein